MKDIATNRRRVRASGKMRIAILAARENGLIWASLFACYWVCSSVANWAFSAMNRRRERTGNPGLNSLALNKAIWEAWDWTNKGEEWTPSENWKMAVVGGIMDEHSSVRGDVLEIGPGGGRWTEFLLGRAQSYIGVDVSQTAIEACHERFKAESRASFKVGSGCDLSAVATDSVDFIWSFDVFVHINRREIALYLDEFRRVLREGGIAVIHHGAVGGNLGGWRSDLSQETMMALVRERGLEAITSFREWPYDGRIHRLDTYNDMITVIRNSRSLLHSSEQGRKVM